jgi:lambda family phage portal protein
MGLAARAIALAEELAPTWAMRRQVARSGARLLNYARHGASRTKKSLVGWVTDRNGPDADVVSNLDTLRERSRDLCQGEGLAIGALRTVRTNEVGPGLRLNAQIDAGFLGLTPEQAQAWEEQVEREWCLWADSKACDAARRSTFGELQALARLSQLMSGDVFALLPAVPRPGDRYELKVQLIEADRCCDPAMMPPGVDLYGGVEIGQYGEPIAYWFTDTHPGDRFTSGRLRMVPQQKWRRIPAFGEMTGRPLVLHLMESERPGQRRGVPLLAPVIEKLKQLSRYTDAELMAAVVSGMFTVAITSDTPQSPLGPVMPTAQQVDPSGGTGDAHETENSYQLGNGAILGLAPGEKAEALNPSRPNAGFDPFVIALCRQIGAGIGLPYELLVMQFTASYSASRAALLEAWKRFTVGRAWLAVNFCRPVYESWLEESVAAGYINAPGFFDDPLIRAAWCGAEWIGPTQGQLDPTKEVEAAKMRVEEGFSTRTRETRELTGGDWWDFQRLRAREEQARRDGGLLPDTVQATPSATPAPSTSTGTQAGPIFLDPEAVASIVTVDQALVSRGLDAIGGEIGDRWVLEHQHRVGAEAAPDIAKVAAAEKAKAPPQETP